MDKRRSLDPVRLYHLLRILAALLIALAFGGGILYIAGFDPLQAYRLIFSGAFGSTKAFLTTLIYATPLLFTGLSFIVARQANVLNLGIEGQLHAGAMSAALVGAYLTGLPGFAHLPLTLAAAALAGGLWAGLAAFLKVRYGANEVITTIMLNYVATLFCGYLVAYPFQDAQGLTQTKRIAPTAQLGRLVQDHSLSKAILFALVLILLVRFLFRGSRFGYQARACGGNQLAAQTAGIDCGRVILKTMFLSGAVSGLCGGLLVCGTYFRFITNFSSGYGFEGVAVATLAAFDPLALILSGILWGGIKSGAAVVNRIASVPMDVIALIQALVVILVAAPRLMDKLLGPLRGLLLKKAGGKEDKKGGKKEDKKGGGKA